MSKKPRVVGLKADELILDPRLQARADGTDPEHVDDMVETLEARKKIAEPVRVMAIHVNRDERALLYVTDGFHTVTAHRKAGRPIVRCLVREGTWKDAVLAAATANQGPAHLAKKMTRADKRRVVGMLLAEFPRMSGRAIADMVKVSHTFATDLKKKLQGHAEPPPPAGVESDAALRDIPLAECNLDLPDFIEAALRSFELTTPGQVYDHIAHGGTLGLKPKQVADVYARLVKAGVGPGPTGKKERKPAPSANGDGEVVPGRPIGTEAAVRDFDDCYGRIVRSHDRLGKAFEVKPGGLHERTAKLLTAIGEEWREWKEKFENPQQRGSDGEEARQ